MFLPWIPVVSDGETREQAAARIEMREQTPPGRTHPLEFPAAAFPAVQEKSAVTSTLVGRTLRMSGVHELDHKGTCSQARIGNAAPLYFVTRGSGPQFHPVVGRQILDLRGR